MAINMGGGIGSFGAAVRDRTDTLSMNPQAMQGAQQEAQRAIRSGIAPDMIDLLSVQAALSAKEAAKKAVEASLNQQPGTIAAQRAEALQDATKDEIVGQVSATLNQQNEQAGQKMAQLQKQLGAPAAGPQMASGGIVGYQAGGSAGAVSSEQKATTILKSMGLTPDQYNSMPPEGQQRVLASLKSMGGGAPARPAPQMMGIAQQPAPQMMGVAQQPAPNMARMAGGGIVAFAPGGSVDDPDADYIPDPEYARQLEIRNNMFRAVGLTPEVYDKLSVEGRQEISAIIRGVGVASPENLRETMPRQIARILNREATALKPPREDPLGIGLFGYEGGEQAKVDDAYKATGPDAMAKYTEALAAQKENNLRAANLRAAAQTANETGFSEFWNSDSGSPNPNLFTPPPAAAATAAPAAPAAQRPPDAKLSPQQAAQGVLGAEIAMPELTAPPLPGTKLASGAIPAAEKARLAGRLGGIDAVNRELRNASGIDAARERAGFVNSPIAFNRQANMDRAQAGIARLQGIRSRQAADVAEYNRNNPFRNFAGLGIGSFAQYGVNQQNQMARNRAAELAEEAEINKRELGITAAELKAGEQAAKAGAQGFEDVAAGQRQAAANMTSLYNTESRKAENAAKNLLTKSMAELTAEQQNIKQAFAFQSAIFTDASRRRTAQIAGAATIAAAQIKTISDDKKRRVEAADAMTKFRKDLEEIYRKVRQDITGRPNLTPEQTKALLEKAQDGFAKSITATKNLFAEALADGQPLLSVNPVTP